MFGGMIQQQDPAIQQSIYGQSNYYVLNFNDVISALGTLFILLLISNMHNIVTGFTAVSIGAYSKLYFVSWYCVGPLLFLNLLMASFLTSFISLMLSTRNVKSKAPHHVPAIVASDTPTPPVSDKSNVSCENTRKQHRQDPFTLCDDDFSTQQEIDDAILRSRAHTMIGDQCVW